MSLNNQTYAFIDGNNLYLGASRQGIELDYRRLRKYLRNKLNVTRAFLFIGFDPTRISFYSFLQQCGFLLVYKPTVVRNENGHKVMKGNVDAELVLYASAIEYNNYGNAVIISSDGDFACLIEYLHKNNKLLKLITPTAHYSSLLRDFSKYILPLSHIADKVRRI